MTSWFRRHSLLVFALLFFELLGVYFALAIPPFEGPDEAQHFSYITWLADGRGLPPQDETAWETPIQQESGQPPFYYSLAAIPARLINRADSPAVFQPNPFFFETTVPNDNNNRAIHHPKGKERWRGGWLAFYLARGMTLLFGGLLVMGVYHLSLTLLPERKWLANGAAFLTAVIPQVLFISSVISNDIPAAALATCSLWLMAVFMRDHAQKKARWGIWPGLFLGLAALTKINTLVLIAPITLGLVWLWLGGRLSFLKAGQTAVWVSFGVFLVSGWWFIRGWALYGSPLGLTPHDQTTWAIKDATTGIAPFFARWQEVGRSFWIALGWGKIRPPGWVYQALMILSLVAIAGLVKTLWRLKDQVRRQLDAFAILGILALSLIALAVFLEYWMHRVVAPYGRLLFPAVSAVTIFLTIGWHSIHPRLPMLAAVIIAVLALLTPSLLLQPAYAPPPTLTPSEINQLPPSVGWQFGEPGDNPFTELISMTPQKKAILTGELLPVQLCWRALAAAKRDYPVLLQIIGPENKLISSRRSYTGQGLRPTSTWVPGDVWCETLFLLIPDGDLPTLVYKLEIAFLDETSGDRLPGYDNLDRPLTNTFLGQVRISGEPAPMVATTPESAADDAVFNLINYDLPATWRTDSENSFALTWQVNQPVTKDYQLFVHLQDASSGEIIAQADGPPLAGWYPTSWWEVGESVTDKRVFDLPTTVHNGAFTLVIGWYDLETGVRITHPIKLGTVQVSQ